MSLLYRSTALIWLVGCPLEAERNPDKPTDSVEPNDTGDTAGPTDSGDSGDTACAIQTFWYDGDADGYGNAAITPIEVCELPFGYTDNADDCDDALSSVNPSATEVCDAVDNDCEGTVDESAIDAPTWYQDLDEDGVGDDDESVTSCANPDGYVATGGDCHPFDSSATTGETWFLDGDNDGWGAEPVTACDQPAGSVLIDGDCDDVDAAVHPEAAELCNGLDEECDDEMDEEATDYLTWYADHDGDGYGIASETTLACEAPAGFVELSTDCDDTTVVISPGAPETCSGLDEDCDGLIDADDPDMAGVATWYLDGDGDGHGVPTSSVSACERPDGYAFGSDDCDDANATVFPAADETCDGNDEDCDGYTDESAIDATIWYADADGDSFGDPVESLTTCEQPADYVDNFDDCDDNEGATSPEGVETCDGFDEDCDGEIDEAVWYADTDADGYGDPDSVDTTCVMPSGYVSDWRDCDDTNGEISPDGVEVCDGHDDEDCDGLIDDADTSVTDQTAWYADADADSWGEVVALLACLQPPDTVAVSGDCDDADATISPDAVEACGGADEDCDGLVDDEDTEVSDPSLWHTDSDADGFGASNGSVEACVQPDGYASGADDCDDANLNISPTARETCTTTEDDNCDGSTNDIDSAGCVWYYYDGDGDGAGLIASSQCTCIASGDYDVTEVTAANDDCDDALATVNPSAPEVCGDGLDNDCEGTDELCSGVVTLQGIDFVNIAASTFEMGCTAAQISSCAGDETAHTVTLTQDYYVTETEVTRAQFEAVVGYLPSSSASCVGDCPVESVDWHESAAFANALSTADGLELCYTCNGTDASSDCSVAMDPYDCDGYRMLTEAEWEGAARCGEDLLYAGSDTVGEVAWYSGNASNTTHAVGGKAPNACGLYDMSGNVWEWTQDWWGTPSPSVVTNPIGEASGSERAIRGGGWAAPAADARVSERNYNITTGPSVYLGFRIARSNP